MTARRLKPCNMRGLFQILRRYHEVRAVLFDGAYLLELRQLRSTVVRGMPTARDKALAVTSRPAVFISYIFRMMSRCANASHVLTPGR
jgi:hypothetical protein